MANKHKLFMILLYVLLAWYVMSQLADILIADPITNMYANAVIMLSVCIATQFLKLWMNNLPADEAHFWPKVWFFRGRQIWPPVLRESGRDF